MPPGSAAITPTDSNIDVYCDNSHIYIQIINVFIGCFSLRMRVCSVCLVCDSVCSWPRLAMRVHDSEYCSTAMIKNKVVLINQSLYYVFKDGWSTARMHTCM